MMMRTFAGQTARLDAMDHAYLHLLVEFCLLAELPFPEAVLEGEEFGIDGIDFRLRVDNKKAPGILNVWCDFGPIIQESPQDVYLSLLEREISHDGIFSSTMAICPETGWVVCCARVPIDRVKATELHLFMQNQAKSALAWQQLNLDGVAGAPSRQDPEVVPLTQLQDDLILLLLQYCQEEGLGWEAVEDLLSGTPLLVNDASFIIHKCDNMPANVCSLYCDYGELPNEAGVGFYHSLLVANMFMFPSLGQSMTLSKGRGHLLLRQDFFVDQMTGQKLRQLIESMASRFSGWKDKKLP